MIYEDLDMKEVLEKQKTVLQKLKLTQGIQLQDVMKICIYH